MDPERPEYHRCNLKWEPAALSSSGAGSFVAHSTGVQVRVEQQFRPHLLSACGNARV